MRLGEGRDLGVGDVAAEQVLVVADGEGVVVEDALDRDQQQTDVDSGGRRSGARASSSS